jgi:glycosyltransferase involved in cell wall biosynthesis
VGFPTAGIPEAVPHDVAGLLVAPGDAEALSEALGRVLGDDELRRRLEEGAKLHAREFSVDVHVERLIAAYRDLL